MIHIFHTSIVETNHLNLIANFLPQFSIEYQEKFQKFRRWEDAQLSLLGRILLRSGMQQINKEFNESNLRFTHYNKPYFKSNIVRFNISHSGEVVVCAITDIGDLGIDIEKIQMINIADFRSQMTLNEWEMVNCSSNNSNSFYKYWTQKEAVIKAHGNGLSIPLKSFEIQNNKTIICSKTFFLKEVPLTENYCCHLALNKDISNVKIKIVKKDSLLFLSL